jgi:transcriptional regulator with XRE-family HTH domain
MKEKSQPDINTRIAQRVSELRAALGFSLDELAARAQVSRSMISLIERGQSSPTAVVLEKLATGLNVTLAALLDASSPTRSALRRHKDQSLWQDPQSGYVRRSVSPAVSTQGLDTAFQIVEVNFPPKSRVAYETGRREPLVHQQIWMLQGRMEVSLGQDTHRLDAGDCLAMLLDRPISYYNPGSRAARYAVVISRKTS